MEKTYLTDLWLARFVLSPVVLIGVNTTASPCRPSKRNGPLPIGCSSKLGAWLCSGRILKLIKDSGSIKP